MHSAIAALCWALLSLIILASLLLSWAAASHLQPYEHVLYEELRNVISGDAVCCTGAAAQSAVVRSAGECALRCGQVLSNCSYFNVIKSDSDVMTCQLFVALPTCFAAVAGCTQFQPIGGLGYNLALYQPTRQSTLFYSSFYAASNAVDCNTDPNPWGGSCSSTNNNQDWPWWAVDLGLVAAVKTVMVTNRNDVLAYSQRLSDFTIGLTDVSPQVASPSPGFNQTEVCFYHPGPTSMGNSFYPCNPTMAPGRYLYVTMPGPNYLTLCEVQVYGYN